MAKCPHCFKEKEAFSPVCPHCTRNVRARDEISFAVSEWVIGIVLLVLFFSWLASLG